MRGEALSPSLAAEGALMRDTLIADLADLPGVTVLATHDDRLPPPPRGTSRPVGAGEDVAALWNALAAEAGRVLPVAPECEGVLADLVARFRRHARHVIAPDDATLRLASSKRATAERLDAAGLAVVPCWDPAAVPPDVGPLLVAKPDDGVGCLDVRLCGPEDLRALPPGTIVQPFVEGAAESLSLLCQNGRARVLTVNRQHVTCGDGVFRFGGVTVGVRAPDAGHQAMAEGVIRTLPGLHGLVGVDYLATPNGYVVVEVNPRATTSTAGLRRALGVNILAFCADLIRDGAVPDLPHLPPPIPTEVLV